MAISKVPTWLVKSGNIEDIFPGFRPPAVLASKEKLTVLRKGDHQVPATAKGSVPATGANLDLMTYNVWGLPGFLGERQKERMSQIGPAVRGHDVVALQETFTKEAAAVGKLSNYDYKLTGSDGGLFRQASGLTMLTSHAVLAHDFVPFTQAAAADRMAQKGVLFMRILVPGTGPVDVYSTHFQARGGAGPIRQHDVDTMVKLVKQHDEGYPTFLMGDFNMTSDSPEYQSLVKQLDLRDVYAERNAGKAGATSSPANTNHKPTDTPNRIDYIFARKNDRYDIAIDSADVGMTQTFNGKHASDHFAVIGHFHITPRPQLKPLDRSALRREPLVAKH
jgi:endonuclease/exonuclease/phosphatase family metal-dependent hydrolase